MVDEDFGHALIKDLHMLRDYAIETRRICGIGFICLSIVVMVLLVIVTVKT